MVGLRKYWNKFLNWLIPNRRKNLLIKMMRNDEEFGLYGMTRSDVEFMVEKIESDPKPNKELINAAKSKKMSKKIVLTQEELQKEIKQAFIHGQGNKEMMEAGLERDETEDYVRSRMRTLLNQTKGNHMIKA